MYAGRNWFLSAAHPLLIANVVNLAVIAVTLPPLLLLLRQLFDNIDVEQTKVWRTIWLLPMSFFLMFISTNNPYDADTFKGPVFLVFRVLIYFAVLLTCYLLKTSLRHVSENTRLKEQARMTERQLYLQREQYSRLAENEGLAKRSRHDIRHHLAVIIGYNKTGEGEKLGSYVEKLAGTMPAFHEKTYCENFAVNAVAAHYITEAERCGIKTDVRLGVPSKTGRVDDMDLCVVMGNLLENALEACRRVEKKRFIRVRAIVDGNFLIIVVENSFDGIWRERETGGGYMSRKETHETRGVGVGISSVQAVCEKYGGLLQIVINGEIWESSALVDMGAV
jgi:sensor histidine kinase YesM